MRAASFVLLKTLGFVAGIAPLAGCAGSASEAQLERPSYFWNREAGHCGGSVAVDGTAGFWSEGGCESGGSGRLGFRRILTEAQRARIEAAFRAHPEPTTFTAPACENGKAERHRFNERTKDGKTRTWEFCVEMFTGMEMPPAPFAATVSAFAATERP